MKADNDFLCLDCGKTYPIYQLMSSKTYRPPATASGYRKGGRLA